MQLTSNEASILSALAGTTISAIVSWRVAAYVVSKSPDYRNEIDKLDRRLAEMSESQSVLSESHQRLSITHEKMLQFQKERSVADETRRENERWRPTATIASDVTTRSNTVNLKGNQEFAVESAAILTGTGAKVSQVKVMPGIFSKGFRIEIPHDALLKLVNNDSNYLKSEQTTGTIRFALSVQSHPVSFDLPFRALFAMNDSACWIRLEG